MTQFSGRGRLFPTSAGEVKEDRASNELREVFRREIALMLVESNFDFRDLEAIQRFAGAAHQVLLSRVRFRDVPHPRKPMMPCGFSEQYPVGAYSVGAYSAGPYSAGPYEEDCTPSAPSTVLAAQSSSNVTGTDDGAAAIPVVTDPAEAEIDAQLGSPSHTGEAVHKETYGAAIARDLIAALSGPPPAPPNLRELIEAVATAQSLGLHEDAARLRRQIYGDAEPVVEDMDSEPAKLAKPAGHVERMHAADADTEIAGGI